MNDLKPFKHGEEGTHYVCQEVLELKGGKATCCGCSGHKCKKPKPMKRIKNPFRKMNVTEKQDLTCPNSYEGEDMKCCRCVRPQYPKPTKIECGLKHKHGYWNCCACCIQGEVKGEGAWGHVKECEFYPKIEKLVIKEDWSETTFEQQKDRLNVHMRYFEDDDNGGKWEGGSSSFSVPLKKLKDYLLSH